MCRQSTASNDCSKTQTAPKVLCARPLKTARHTTPQQTAYVATSKNCIPVRWSTSRAKRDPATRACNCRAQKMSSSDSWHPVRSVAASMSQIEDQNAEILFSSPMPQISLPCPASYAGCMQAASLCFETSAMKLLALLALKCLTC